MDYGYICFAYSKNEWIAKAIAWFTQSQWSHTFFTTPDILGKQMATEASGKGVSMVSFDDGYRNNPNQAYEVYRLKSGAEKIDQSILNVLNMLETPYGYLEYPWFIWRSLILLFGVDIKANNNWIQQGTICSGLSRMFIEGLGWSYLFNGFGKDSANAQDVYEIVKAHPELFELIESKH